MFNFLNNPYMSGSQTSRNSYRPTQRGFDPWGSFVAEPEPVYYYEPRRSVYNRGTPYYDAEYMPRQAPVRNNRASYNANRRPMNQSMVFEEPTLSKISNEPRRVQRPQQQPQQPRMHKQHPQERPAQKIPQNTNTRRTRETAPQDPFGFFDVFGGDSFFGNSRAPVRRPEMAEEHRSDEEVAGSSHTPVETMRQEPAYTQKTRHPENGFFNRGNESKTAGNTKPQQQAKPQAKPKASAQPNKKAAKEEPVSVPQPKIIRISGSEDPKDLVMIEDVTPAQERKVEGKQPSNGLIIEEVNPQQA